MGILYKKKKTKFELLSIIAIYLFMFAIPILLNNKNEEQPEKVAHGTLTYREGIRGRIITIINDGSSTLELSCAENMFMDRPNCFSKKEYDKIKNKKANVIYKEKNNYPLIGGKTNQIQKIEISTGRIYFFCEEIAPNNLIDTILNLSKNGNPDFILMSTNTVILRLESLLRFQELVAKKRVFKNEFDYYGKVRDLHLLIADNLEENKIYIGDSNNLNKENLIRLDLI